jgi:hypothetical protein
VASPRAVFRFIGRSGRRVGITIAGGALVLIGLIGVIAPIIPGPVLIIGGLAVLATEYAWARRALDTAKRRAKQVADRVRRRRGTLPPNDSSDEEDPPAGTASG